MRQVRQTTEELLSSLSLVETHWADTLSRSTIELIDQIPGDKPFTEHDLLRVLQTQRNEVLLLAQLVLDRSKDEFRAEFDLLRSRVGARGKSERLGADKTVLAEMGVVDAINAVRRRPVTWRDLLAERLKSGRGSAIKGQYRGRALEDYVEAIVAEVFGASSYDSRTSFVGKDGVLTAKCDFAVPSKSDPRIVIEVKAFGATGSKQTNVVGDADEIIRNKRHDTFFLLFTDGLMWARRSSDLSKLVDRQNQGDIYRIYTQKMRDDFRTDLSQMRSELGL